MPEFNLIVVHEPGIENYVRARDYVKQVLGDRAIYAYSYQSVVLYRCMDDPHVCAEAIRRGSREAGVPIIKAIPVDSVTRADVASVRESVRRLASRIPQGETFRVTLKGHLERVEGGRPVELSSDEAVREIAKEVDRPVNLTQPDWIVYVRVVRMGLVRVAAVSLLKPFELERISEGWA